MSLKMILLFCFYNGFVNHHKGLGMEAGWLRP
jgi:hypothetical protein